MDFFTRTSRRGRARDLGYRTLHILHYAKVREPYSYRQLAEECCESGDLACLESESNCDSF